MTSAAYAYKFGDFPGKASKQVWTQANLHLNSGLHLAREGKYDQAIPEMQRAIDMYPYDAAYYYSLGVCYESRKRSGDMLRAEQFYKKSINLAPSVWETWNAMATPLYATGKYSESRAAKMEALRLGPPAEDIPGIKADIKAVTSKIQSMTSSR
ncbi:MAG: tetratricopeptide repeat protein [Candidatus Obscuribacterales bacterium]|nr:tetratricopeptide repeat protein [Candidatus Obscuribacterales bacterium]